MQFDTIRGDVAPLTVISTKKGSDSSQPHLDPIQVDVDLSQTLHKILIMKCHNVAICKINGTCTFHRCANKFDEF